MRVLVTGATGFVGGYVVRELLAGGHEVHGTALRPGDAGGLPGEVHLHALDVADPAAAAAVVADAAPEACVHLAARAMPREVSEDRGRALEVNALGTWHVAAAFAAAAPPGPFVLASTSYVYAPPAGGDLGEDHPVGPAHPYGLSKLAAEGLAREACGARGTRAVVLRLFNHIGPGQAPGYLVPDLLARLRDIAAARARGDAGPPCRVGNLDTERDFTDVRDVARAYRLVVEHPDLAGTLNIGSGRGTRPRDILAGLARALGIEPELEVDPALARPGEIPRIVARVERARELLGWEPTRDLDATLRDVVAG